MARTPTKASTPEDSPKIAIKGDPSKPSAWNSLTVPQLKVHLKDQELDQEGKKTDLIERLVLHFEGKQKKEAAAAKEVAAKEAAAKAAANKEAKAAAQKSNTKSPKKEPASRKQSATTKKNAADVKSKSNKGDEKNEEKHKAANTAEQKTATSAKKVENGKKPTEAAKDSSSKSEKKSDPKKSAGNKMAGAKYNGKVPSGRQMKKEINSMRMQHSIAVYPIGMADMNHPTVISSLAKCKTFGVRFYRLDEEIVNDKDFIGCLQIQFKHMPDAVQALGEFKTIREDLTVYQMGGSAGNEAQLIGMWNKMIENASGVDSRRDKTDFTMFIPNPPTDVEMEELRKPFKDVEEAALIAEEHDRHAWVVFKSKEGLKKAVDLVQADRGAGGHKFDGYLYKDLLPRAGAKHDASSDNTRTKGILSSRGPPAQGTRGPAARGSNFGVRGTLVQRKTSLTGQRVGRTHPSRSPQLRGDSPPSSRGAEGHASRPRTSHASATTARQSLIRLKENAQQRQNVLNARRGRSAYGFSSSSRSDRPTEGGPRHRPTAHYQQQQQQGPREADRRRGGGPGIGLRHKAEAHRLRQDPVPLPLSLSQLIPGVMDQPSRDMGHSTAGGSGGFNSLLGVPQDSGMRGGADRMGRTSDQHSRQWSSGSGGAMAGLGHDSAGGYGGDLPSRDFRQSGGSAGYDDGLLGGGGGGAGGGGGRGMRGDSGFRGGDGGRMGDPTPAVKEDPIYARSLAMMGSSDYGAQPGAARRKQSRWDGDAQQDEHRRGDRRQEKEHRRSEHRQSNLLGSPSKRRMNSPVAMDHSPKRIRGNDDFGYQAGRQDTSYQLGGRGVDNNDLQGGVGGGDLYGGRRDNYDLGGRDAGRSSLGSFRNDQSGAAIDNSRMFDSGAGRERRAGDYYDEVGLQQREREAMHGSGPMGGGGGGGGGGQMTSAAYESHGAYGADTSGALSASHGHQSLDYGGGKAAHWEDSSPAKWESPSAIKWDNNSAAKWGSDSAAKWENPSAAKWDNGSAAKWSSDSAAKWENPSAAKWDNDSAAKWGNDSAAKWGSDSTPQWDGGQAQSGRRSLHNRDSPRMSRR